MNFTPEHNFRASLERMVQARQIHQRGGAYALAMYSAGVAVECLLRALMGLEYTAFEGRHNVALMVKNSRLLQIHDEYMSFKGESAESVLQAGLELRAAVNQVVAFWHNSLRYASEQRLRTHLRSINRLMGCKGDPLKKNSQDLLESAQRIIDRGQSLWNLRTK